VGVASGFLFGGSDGASWIVNRYDLQFGTYCQFLVDFYHVCEYLAAASHGTTMELSERRATGLKTANTSLITSV
jgi:hypothetical protein